MKPALPAIETTAPVLRDIQSRLSLRAPLAESLHALDRLCREAGLAAAPGQDVAALEAAVQALHPESFQRFGRGFPSIAYSIATGVGKTRLMAACVLYLFRTRGVRNFFILAPNLTIYNKLIRDFGEPGYAKYVFRGVPEFVTNRPVVVTGDNYAQQGGLFSGEEVRINIFNIAKFNSDTKVSKKDGRVQQPRIKRLSEYLGQSYWSYLAGLDDLVILMDEAHRYHADASRNAIEELRPLLGIELTATPFDEKGKPFLNVVYEYSLAQALTDGRYVKIPAVATRRNFSFDNLGDSDLDRLKLEDGISVHEDTKQALTLYSRDTGQPLVKPFVLVACRDISHAKEVFEFVQSNAFYGGAYRGKVLQVDSSTKEDAEIEKLLTVERPDNPVEIVIHVGMLKEGWDVNNLYTIVPLRASNAPVLIEQTLGRGLRLPFGGERTGVEKVDMLTVIAHENFQKVIEAAKDPDSILRKVRQIELDPGELGQEVEIVTTKTNFEMDLDAQKRRIREINDEKERQSQMIAFDAKSLLVNILPTLNRHAEVRSYQDLLKPGVREEVLQTLEAEANKGQMNLFAPQIVEEAKAQYEAVVRELRQNIIEIPRFTIMPAPAKTWFDDFDLDTTEFDFSRLDLELIRVALDDSKATDTIVVRRNTILDTPERILMTALADLPEIDPDTYAGLRYKLCCQAVEVLRAGLPDKEKELREIVFDNRDKLAERIHAQLMRHFHVEDAGYDHSQVLPFTRIEPWNFSLYKDYGRKHWEEQVKKVEDIPKYLWYGFVKACHPEYKFQSKAEKDFAAVCEQDTAVLRWLRPARYQFSIYWNRQHDLYSPDFVVETADTIFIVESKSTKEIGSEEVMGKMNAALKYCAEASRFNAQHGGKPWRYLLIPHTEVLPLQRNLAYFVQNFQKKDDSAQ